MAQTTGGVSAVNAVVEYSLNGSVWKAASSHSNKVTPSGGDRAVGEMLTFDGDVPILTGGKRASHRLAVDAVYTETSGEIFRDAIAAQQAGSPFYVRYTVKAATTGNMRYTSDAGILTKAVFPMADAGDPKPVMTSLELACANITPAAIP